MQRFFQLAFWLAIATTLYLCIRHSDVVVPVSDKSQHAFAFGALTLLAVGAYPKARSWALAFALSGFGALIEFVQPYFGRDKDVRDWVADTIGILTVLLLVWGTRKLLLRSRNSPR